MIHIFVDATVFLWVHFIQLYLNKRCKSFSTKGALFKKKKGKNWNVKEGQRWQVGTCEDEMDAFGRLLNVLIIPFFIYRFPPSVTTDDMLKEKSRTSPNQTNVCFSVWNALCMYKSSLMHFGNKDWMQTAFSDVLFIIYYISCFLHMVQAQ